jgi:hypothetical protein
MQEMGGRREVVRSWTGAKTAGSAQACSCETHDRAAGRNHPVSTREMAETGGVSRRQTGTKRLFKLLLKNGALFDSVRAGRDIFSSLVAKFKLLLRRTEALRTQRDQEECLTAGRCNSRSIDVRPSVVSDGILQLQLSDFHLSMRDCTATKHAAASIAPHEHRPWPALLETFWLRPANHATAGNIYHH